MKPHGISPRHQEVLARLSLLPRKIIARYSDDHTSEFTLHELCHLTCFDLEKAAYFVDNPDFDCLQGIAGYHKAEHDDNLAQELEEPELFSRHLRTCRFNQRVRTITGLSYRRARKTETDILKFLAPLLTISDPCCYIWPLKHDNYGILIYERGKIQAEELREHIENGIHILSLCSLF